LVEAHPVIRIKRVITAAIKREKGNRNELVFILPPFAGDSGKLKNIDFQKNNFTALSVGDGRKWPIPDLLPCEMNFLKVYKRVDLDSTLFIFYPKCQFKAVLMWYLQPLVARQNEIA
jgi:hypothetical protein